MKIVLYTNSVSAHQLPLSKELVELVGSNEFQYVYTGSNLQHGGQEIDADDDWITTSNEHLYDCEVLLSGVRNVELLEHRCKNGLATYYMSERWLKPISLGVGNICRCSLPGWLRLLHPGYFKMVRRFVKLFDYLSFRYLPQGKWAEHDMALLCRAMGRTMPPEKVIPWGYFVAPSDKKDNSTLQLQLPTTTKPLRVLWVGRMIGWKRVDTIIKAVTEVAKSGMPITCTLVGSGLEKEKWIRLAQRLEKGVNNSIADLDLQPRPIFTFKDSIPITKIRDEMRSNDVYVLASNGEEGWGAALNEAMEEGMFTLGTFEAGASSYVLPDTHKFKAGDWRRLAELLQQVADGKLDRVHIGEWTAERAAERLLAL